MSAPPYSGGQPPAGGNVDGVEFEFDAEDAVAIRTFSRPSVDDLWRRVEVLGQLPPSTLRTELSRARHVDLQDLVLVLLARLRTAGQARPAATSDEAANPAEEFLKDEDVAADDPERYQTFVADLGSVDSDSDTRRRGAVPDVQPVDDEDGGDPQARVASVAMSGSGRTSSDRGLPRRSVTSSNHRTTSTYRRASSRVRSSRPNATGATPSLHVADPWIDDGTTAPAEHSPQNPLAGADFGARTTSLAHSGLREGTPNLPPGVGSRSVSTDGSGRLDSISHRSLSELPEVHEFRRQSGAPAYVKLRYLYFYQDYISDRFGDGRPLQQTIEQLRKHTATPATFPPLRVARRSTDGKYYSLCNRRLACYHYVYRNNPDFEVPVLMRRELGEHMLPQGDGQGYAVRVGGGIVLDGRLVWEIRHCLHPAPPAMPPWFLFARP